MEHQIAERLKQSIPKPQIESSTPAEPVIQEEAATPALPGTSAELATFKLLGYFGLPQEAYSDRSSIEKLSAIHNLAGNLAESTDVVDVMTYIKRLEGQLGLTYRTDDRLESVYRWLKLNKEKQTIEKEMALI